MAIDKIRPRVEFKPAVGIWQDWTEDVSRVSGIEVTRGIHGDGPADRVAEPGIAQFSMLNTASNSGGKQGYYSPGNANLRPGFAKGMGCRISIVANADACVDSDCVSSDCVSVATVQAIHTGDVTEIEPEPGQHFATLSHVTSIDYMEQLSRADTPACNVLQGVNESDAVITILDAMGTQPRTAAEVTIGEDTFSYWGDLTRGEEHKAITAIQEIAQSSHGTFYVKGDGAPVYEPRNVTRAVNGSPLTSTIDLLESDLRAGRVPQIVDNTRVSKVKTTMALRALDGSSGSEVVLASLTDSMAFPVGVTTFTLPFNDPDEEGVRAGGISMVTPVENTDYDFNSEEDGSGTDHSGDVTVTATFCGNNVKFEVDTTSAGVLLYPVTSGGVVRLQARGIGVISNESLFFEAEDTTIDQNTLTVNLPYQSETEVAQALATWYKDTLSEDERLVKTVPLRLDQSNVARAIEIMQLEISDGVTIVETVTGLDGTEKFIVNAIDYDIQGDGSIWPILYLAPWDTGPFIEFGADHLTTSGVTSSSDDITSATTASVTPTGGRLVTVMVAAKRSTSDPGTPTVSGLGATWTLEDDVIYDGAGGDRRRMWLFSAVESSYTAGKITIDNFGGTSEAQGRISWSVSHHPTTGTSSATAVVQTATNSAAAAGSLTVTLAAFANALNLPVAFFACSADDLMEAESGYDILGRRGKRTSVMTMENTTTADTTPTATIPSAASRSGGIAIEVKKD